jgi:hypothetical protein
MPDAVTLDPGNVGPSLGETPQRRRAETPEADHNHVFAQNFHQRRTLAVRSSGGKRRESRSGGATTRKLPAGGPPHPAS